ncbi:Hypp1544 [Branchiostoma lanceolatum]|uniref:Hypp1544 protein n=1 Tax=Branchiostoma lanceolatum TaxID=7740 RepID=A0A8J9ZM86_BRALA|nr:Hypp1544 [Branchiostoma lanceolatum]
MCMKKEGCMPEVDFDDNWTVVAVCVGSMICLGFVYMAYTAFRYGILDPPKFVCKAKGSGKRSSVTRGVAAVCGRTSAMCGKKGGCIPDVDPTDDWTLVAIIIGSMITLGFVQMTYLAVRYGLMDPPKVSRTRAERTTRPEPHGYAWYSERF